MNRDTSRRISRKDRTWFDRAIGARTYRDRYTTPAITIVASGALVAVTLGLKDVDLNQGIHIDDNEKTNTPVLSEKSCPESTEEIYRQPSNQAHPAQFASLIASEQLELVYTAVDGTEYVLYCDN